MPSLDTAVTRERGSMIRFSRISRHGIGGRLLRAPLRLIPRSTVLPVLQGPLRGARWISGSFVHGCWLGSYESELQAAFAREIPEGGVVFDVGANVGFYTLLASRRVGPKGRVFAFEPLPRNIGFLRRHIRLNRAENVTVIEAAVFDEPGEAEFRVARSHARGGLERASTPAAAISTVRVQVVQLDRLFRDGTIPAPSVMKVDIEGAEAGMLAGARTIIAHARPVILLATHGDEVRTACLEFLRELDYDVEPVNARDPAEADEFIARHRKPVPEIHSRATLRSRSAARG